MNVISGSVVGGELSFWRLRDGINVFFIMIILTIVILKDLYSPVTKKNEPINVSLRPIFTRCIFIRSLYLKIIYLGKNHLEKIKFSYRNEALRHWYICLPAIDVKEYKNRWKDRVFSSSFFQRKVLEKSIPKHETKRHAKHAKHQKINNLQSSPAMPNTWTIQDCNQIRFCHTNLYTLYTLCGYLFLLSFLK